MNLLEEYEGTIVDNITKINKNGWWQVYVIDEDNEDNGYVPLGNRILFFNGKFYDNNSKEPWEDSDVDSIGNMMHLYNADDLPRIVVKMEQAIEGKNS